MKLWFLGLGISILFFLGSVSGKFYPLVNLLWLIYSLSILGLTITWVRHHNKIMENIIQERPDPKLADKKFPLYISEFTRSDMLIFKLSKKIEIIEYNLLNQKARQAGESLDLMLKATTDPLTGVPNREQLNTHLGKVLGKVTPLSLVMVDIDYFKKINDTYGHDAGDVVLKKFAQLVRRSMRPSDYLFRYGGEEFLIVSNADSQETVEITERVRMEIASVLVGINERDTVNITASFGVAEYHPGDSQDTLIKRADEALYNAKQSGRNKVCMEVCNK